MDINDLYVICNIITLQIADELVFKSRQEAEEMFIKNYQSKEDSSKVEFFNEIKSLKEYIELKIDDHWD